eukprot:753116-Hanusia_phi.AAC.1
MFSFRSYGKNDILVARAPAPGPHPYPLSSRTLPQIFILPHPPLISPCTSHNHHPLSSPRGVLRTGGYFFVPRRTVICSRGWGAVQGGGGLSPMVEGVSRGDEENNLEAHIEKGGPQGDWGRIPLLYSRFTFPPPVGQRRDEGRAGPTARASDGHTQYRTP